MPSSRVDKAPQTAGEITSTTAANPTADTSKGHISRDDCASTKITRAGEEARVDDILESLHRSLKDQETVQRMLAAVKRPTYQPRIEPGAALSGATATRKPLRRAPEIHVQVRKQKTQKAPLKEPRAVSSARCLVGAAESLGMDMSAAKGLILSSERKLARRKPKAAASEAAKALAYARHAASTQLLSLIPELEARISSLRANGGRSVPAERSIAVAKAAMKKRNYRTAIAAVSGARKILSDAQTAFIRRILLESREKFVSAKKAGANIDTAVVALMKAKENLHRGDLGAAVRMARRAETAVDVTMTAHREASRGLIALARALSVADQVEADVAESKKLMAQSRALFDDGAYFKSSELSKSALSTVDTCLRDKILESVERAEIAVALARDAGTTVTPFEAKLKEAKSRLTKREYMKTVAMANEVLVDATSEALTVMRDRIGGIGQFAKSVAGEIESLSQVQDAIVHSRERSLEMARKYSSMSEDIVSQAYDNAAAYMRVSQDIVKQAYDSSVGIDPGSKEAEPRQAIIPSASAAQILGIGSYDRKLRIIDLYLSGRIDDKQLDKLLALVDSSSPGIEISDEVPEAQYAKR